MNRTVPAFLLMGVLAGTLACGPAVRYQTVTYPPRIDLAKHELIGVIQFSSPDKKGLAPVATSRFTEEARRDQGEVRMLSLGAESSRPDPARIQQLAKQYGVNTIVIGELRISKVKPAVAIAETLSSGNVSAQIEATLAVEMIEASSGASLWSASARTRESLGNLHVQGGGGVSFNASDPDAAYAALVDTLVGQVTQDMRSTWERRRID